MIIQVMMKFLQPNQKICCNDVIQCIFNLNTLDITVYKKLKETKEARTDELAKKINRERSTVYRSLQKLTCSDLCIKKTNTLENGGYYHTYTCKDIKKTKEKLEKCIDEWYEKMKATIKELE